MKILLSGGRLLAIAGLFIVTFFLDKLEAQPTQQPAQTSPGTPATATPQTSTAPLTAPSQPGATQSQTGNAAAPSLFSPWFIQLEYWLPSTKPFLKGGLGAIGDDSLEYPRNRKYAPDVALSIPVSKSGMLNFSGFITKGSVGTTANDNLALFGTAYSSGDFLTATYTVKDFKLSYQDLLYPFPRKEGQKWRVKTLWEVQYASIKTNLNAPFAPTTDSSGNPIVNSTTGSRQVIYPTLGLAGEFHPTRNLELELNGSGFAIPHHSTLGEGEVSIGYRISHVELLIGEKYFHFKSTPQNTEYFSTTLLGAYGALRLYPGGISIPCVFCRRRNTTTAGNPAPSTTATGEAPAGEAPPGSGPTTSSSSSSSGPKPGTYVRRFSAGATLSVLGQSLIPGRSSTINTSANLVTSYTTTGASERIGYGVMAQVALTDRFAFVADGLLRRIGYQLATTVTTTTPTVIAGVQTTTTNSTGVHEDTRATLIDVPGMLRFYTRSRHEPGPRWFLEAGGAWRDVRSIRTSTSTTNTQSQLSCCTFTPAQPLHRSVTGAVVGGGVTLIDAFGIHFTPEVRYTRWMGPIFESLTTDTRESEISAGFTLSF